MLDEAIHLRTGSSLCSLFLSMLQECFPSQPLLLWEHYKDSLCNDLKWTLSCCGLNNPSTQLAHDYGLHLLQVELGIDTNKSLTDLGLIEPQNDWNRLLGNDFFCEHLSYDPSLELQHLLSVLPLLNSDQQMIFNHVLDAVLAKSAQVFFVEGAAGAGKTFVYNALCHTLQSHELIAICVASSSIAALLLPGGRTAHSCYKIPIDIHAHSICSLTKHSVFAAFIKAVNLIIWDECSMQHRFAFEAVDRTLQDLRECSLPFGGIPTVLGGDFLQTLPVVKQGKQSDIVHVCILSSPLWPMISPNMFKLHQNMCLGNNPTDREFATWLRQLARGDLNDDVDVVIPPFLLCPSNSIAELIKHCYPTVHIPQPDSYFQNHCMLCPHNEDVRGLNDIILDSFPGLTIDLWSVDKAIDPENPHIVLDNYPPKFLCSQTPSGSPLHI